MSAPASTGLPELPDPARTAVVLSSSFLGVYAHAGFLNALDQADFTPARIAGSSAGALAGAMFACGLRGDTLRDAATDPSLRSAFLDIGGLWRWPGVATSFWSSGIFHGKRLVRHLRQLLGERSLDDLPLPLDIAVTNVLKTRAEIRNHGPLAEFVMASCAVPGLFSIQAIGDERFLDGGIAAEHPYEHLIDDPAIDTILIHRIDHQPGSGPCPRWENSYTAVGASHATASNELHRLRQQRAELAGKKIIECLSITPFPGLVRHRRAIHCHDIGYQSGQQFCQTNP